MRTRICYPFILLIALLTTVSCENELPFSVKDNPPKLVMNALINADSLTNVLYLNFTGRGYATHVENATVEVRVNGQLSESLRPLPPQTEGDMPFPYFQQIYSRRCSSYWRPHRRRTISRMGWSDRTTASTWNSWYRYSHHSNDKVLLYAEFSPIQNQYQRSIQRR